MADGSYLDFSVISRLHLLDQTFVTKCGFFAWRESEILGWWWGFDNCLFFVIRTVFLRSSSSSSILHILYYFKLVVV